MKNKMMFLVGTVLTSATVFGQISTPATTAPTTGKPQLVEEVSAFDFILKGGIFLIPIAILLFYTIFVIVERYLFIKNNTKVNANLLNEIRQNLNQGNIDAAVNAASRENNAFGSVIKEGIQTIGRPMAEIESNMEKVVNIEVGSMEKKIGHLGLISGIAPTLGFIGTISGVIKIFYSISISEDISIGNISGGLYEKMISSGSGLIVGIIAFAGYHLLNGKIDNYALNIQKSILEFIQILQRPNNGNQAK